MPINSSSQKIDTSREKGVLYRIRPASDREDVASVEGSAVAKRQVERYRGLRDAAVQAEQTTAVRDRADITPASNMEAGDPRWVLALRVAQSLEGAILPPEKRERLMRMGKAFGLTAFDTNLVIAIVQDQARRGHEPQLCPKAGAAQLSMVPQPRKTSIRQALFQDRAWRIALVLTGLIALEIVLLVYWLG